VSQSDEPIMDLARRVLDHAAHVHGDGIEAFVLLTKMFADVVAILGAEAEPREPVAKPIARQRKRRARAAAAEPPPAPRKEKPAEAPIPKRAQAPAVVTAPSLSAPGAGGERARDKPQPDIAVALTKPMPKAGLEPKDDVITWATFMINRARATVTRGTDVVQLTRLGIELLYVLSRAAPQPIAIDAIASRMTWPPGGSAPTAANAERLLREIGTSCDVRLKPIGVTVRWIKGVGLALQLIEPPAAQAVDGAAAAVAT
jgi:hypothetical protein